MHATPLTRAELGIWLGHQSSHCPQSYNCGEAVSLSGPLDVPAFERAVTETLECAETSRRRFVEVKGEPRAEPTPLSPTAFRIVDLSAETRAEEQARLQMRRLLATPVALEAGELCKHRLFVLGPGRHLWFHQAHHLALDGYGFHLVRRAIEARYRLGKPAQGFGELADVRAEDAAYESSTQAERDRQFWLHGPGSGAAALRLSDYRTREAALLLPPEVARRQSFALDAELRCELTRLGAASQSSWVDALIALVAGFVAQSTGRSQFALGLPVMLRLRSAAARVPCMAMNVNRLPLVVPPEHTPIATVAAVRERVRRQSPHQRFRYERLRENRRVRAAFGPMINVLPFETPTRFGDCHARVENLSAGPAEELSLAFYPSGTGLRCDIDAHPAAYRGEALEALASDLGGFVQDRLADVERPWREPARSTGFARLPAAERGPEDVISVVERRARLEATRAALVWDGGELDYAELLARARGVAAWLSHRGVRRGDRVVLDVSRSPHALVLALGTLWAGCAYVAIDPALPERRKRAILDQASATLVVSELPPTLPARTPPRAHVRENDPAYAVFTSGSTGMPKGVDVSRGALSHFAWAAARRYGITRRDRLLQFASLAFDASVEELFVTLSQGGTLVWREESMLGSMRAFLAACAERRVTVLDLPTAFFLELCWSLEHQDLTWPSSVHTVIIGGEVAHRAPLASFSRRARGVRLLNSYGPSEATVVATVAELSERELGAEGPIPIGRPLEGVGAEIRNDAGRWLQGPGAEGELCLFGPTLASGYLGRDDWTDERFGLRAGASGSASGRYYRTGDRVRRLDDGQLAFLGRTDDEVKISGYRVCLPDVEAAILRHPSVVTCAVLARRDGPLTTLQAFVEAGEGVDASALATFALGELPAPMLPARWILAPRLPRNVAGKVDRQRLVDGCAVESPGAVGPASPASALERDVYQAWRAVVGCEPSSPDADFFESGGSSLQIIQLVNRLSVRGHALGVALAFENPTPRRLARALEREGRPASSADDAMDFRRVPELPEAWFEAAPPRAAAPGRRVLLTGATGFVGRYLLLELLRRGCEVSCIVRGASTSLARARLQAALAGHGPLPEASQRLRVIAADLGDPELASRLSNGELQFDELLHCAANVSLSRDYESLWRANVQGTRCAIELCARRGARLGHVSSLAVAPAAGERVREAFFEPHAGLRDGYQRSKWHAEALCQRASERGLSVSVYRLGRVSGARRAPEINPSDIVWRIVRASLRARSWPQLELSEPWMPVDDTAVVIAELTLEVPTRTDGAEPRVYNLAHNGQVRLGRVRDALAELGIGMAEVPLAAWLRRVAQRADDEDRATLSFFERRTEQPGPPSLGPIDCERLRADVGDRGARPVDDELLRAYCRSAIERWAPIRSGSSSPPTIR